MKHAGLLVIFGFCNFFSEAQIAGSPDLSEKTAGPVLQKVMRIMGDSTSDFRALYDTVFGRSPSTFVSTVAYPGAAKTLFTRMPNTINGDVQTAYGTWECTLIETATGASGGFDKQMSDFRATLLRLYPRAIKTGETSFELPGKVQLYLMQSVSSAYKIPDYLKVHISAIHKFKVPPAHHIASILNRGDSLLERATSVRAAENHVATLYENLRVEGILPEKIATMFAPSLAKADSRFPGLAFVILMRLPFDAKIKEIVNELPSALQSSIRAAGQKSVDDFYASYRPASTEKVVTAAPVQTYRQPTVMACDHCRGRGYFDTGKPTLDATHYTNFSVYRHGWESSKQVCGTCRGSGIRYL